MNGTELAQITYTDETGAEYCDTLTLDELAISPDWLERITSVTMLEQQPLKTHKGKRAQIFLTKQLSYLNGFYIRSRNIQELAKKYYEVGRQDRAYTWIYRNHIKPLYGISYQTYLRYLNTKIPDNFNAKSYISRIQ